MQNICDDQTAYGNMLNMYHKRYGMEYIEHGKRPRSHPNDIQ